MLPSFLAISSGNIGSASATHGMEPIFVPGFRFPTRADLVEKARGLMGVCSAGREWDGLSGEIDCLCYLLCTSYRILRLGIILSQQAPQIQPMSQAAIL
jgi:hypothetical protein